MVYVSIEYLLPTTLCSYMYIWQVRDALNLSYKNSEELNRIIDTKLPGRPQFTRREVVQSGEVIEFYMHDIIECLRTLWGDLDFDGDLILEPE